MPTINISVTSTWTQIASTTDTDFLASWYVPVTIEVATTTGSSAPTVDGHRLTQSEQITRTVFGTGYVWAKLSPGSSPASVNMVVSK